MASKFGLSLDAIYYSAFALLCAYFIIIGAQPADILVAYPLFFILLSYAALQVLLYLLQLLVALKKSVSAPANEVLSDDDYKNGLMILLVQALALGFVYSSVSPSSAGEFFAPLSLAFFAISIVQVFYHTYPYGKMVLRERVKRWVESAHKFGSVPGMVALAGCMIGIILFTPIFNEPATQILKAATGKFILEGIAVLAIYLGLRARKGDAWVGAGSPRDMLLGVAAFIIAFILFEFVIKGLTHTQIVLASFAAAYALLSYIAWKQAREGQGGTANF